MKKIIKIFKWFFISLMSLILLGVIILLIIGFPKPGAITRADNIPYIDWTDVFKNFPALKSIMDNSILIDWQSDGDALYIVSKTGFLKRNFSKQTSAETVPITIEGIPHYASYIYINPNINKKNAVIAIDELDNGIIQLYRFNFDDNSLTQISDDIDNFYNGYFNSNGAKFFYSSINRNTNCFDYYIVEPEFPKSTKLVFSGNILMQEPLSFSPVSDDIILVNDKRIWTARRLYILTLSTGEKTFLETDTIQRINHGADYTGAGSPAVWGKDAKFIYYLGDKNSEFQQLYAYDVVQKKNQNLVNTINGDIVDLNITANKDKIIYKTVEDGYSKIYVYDISEKNSKQLNIPKGSVGTIAIHPVRNILAISLLQTSFVKHIISYDIDNDKVEYWYNKDINIPKTEQIRYFSNDSVNGKPLYISAWKFIPENISEKKYPVLIELHGGPVHQSPNAFWDMYKCILDLGIVIISPNYRGSLGYGKSFELADNEYNRLNPLNDIGALLDWIETQPDLDNTRVGVIGASYGGYMVLSALTKYSDRIICGIDAFGISNISTQLKNSEVYAQNVRRSEFGDERIPEMQIYLDSISPLSNAHRITVPLFVFQGMKDKNVLPSESEQIVKATNANGNRVWYITAENEEHGLRNPMNVLYVTCSFNLFIDEYLLKNSN